VGGYFSLGVDMRRRLLVGLVGLGVFMLGAAGHTADVRAPQSVSGAPGSRQSAELATRAAVAQMNGRPADALALAQQGIRANQNDPWPYYDEAMALSELGQVDAASAAFLESQRRFLPGDLWGKSVALYGRGYAYLQAGRCADAHKAFADYAALVGSYDPNSVKLVHRYEDDCRASLLKQSQPAPPSTPAVPAR
jgi:tetratricopeptide (TPR) repeat protein